MHINLNKKILWSRATCDKKLVKDFSAKNVSCYVEPKQLGDCPSPVKYIVPTKEEQCPKCLDST